MTRSGLLVFNRSAGVGHGAAEAERLAAAIGSAAGDSPAIQTAVLDGHPAARAAARDFASRSPKPVLVIAAGGGGTLRAVVEGVADAFPGRVPGADEVCIGALRMGSGNVIARRLGMDLDPLVAAAQIGRGWVEGRTKPCAVLRCTHGAAGGGQAVRHAVTMAGLGEWGRVPGDIARWRVRHATGRRRAASRIGLERVNTVEYLGFGAVRMLAGTMRASRCEMVEVDGGRRFRLLAAVALNLPLPPLPDPHVTMGDAAAGLVVVPRLGRPWRQRIEPGRPFKVRFLDRPSVEFFLDEDPETACGWLELEVPGCLAFVAPPAA